jgi:hypothetical protein
MIYIVIPTSVELLVTSCFFQCQWHTAVTFGSKSLWVEIEEHAFCTSGLTYIVISLSVEFIETYALGIA